jgi:hypothetical protein
MLHRPGAALIRRDSISPWSRVRLRVLQDLEIANRRASAAGHLVERMDHRAARQQLAVVVAAIDTRDEAVDAAPDVDGVVHDLPAMMTSDARRGTRRTPRFPTMSAGGKNAGGCGQLRVVARRFGRDQGGLGHDLRPRGLNLDARPAAQPFRTSLFAATSRWRDPDSNRGHHDFQMCGPVSESALFAGVFGKIGEPADVRVFPHFADVCRTKRPTAGSVGLFVSIGTGDVWPLVRPMFVRPRQRADYLRWPRRSCS